MAVTVNDRRPARRQPVHRLRPARRRRRGRPATAPPSWRTARRPRGHRRARLPEPGTPTNNLGGDGPTPPPRRPPAAGRSRRPDAAGARARRRVVGRRPPGRCARAAGACSPRAGRRRDDGACRLVGRRRDVGGDSATSPTSCSRRSSTTPRSRPPAPTPSATSSRSARCRRCASGASRSACSRSCPSPPTATPTDPFAAQLGGLLGRLAPMWAAAAGRGADAARRRRRHHVDRRRRTPRRHPARPVDDAAALPPGARSADGHLGQRLRRRPGPAGLAALDRLRRRSRTGGDATHRPVRRPAGTPRRCASPSSAKDPDVPDPPVPRPDDRVGRAHRAQLGRRRGQPAGVARHVRRPPGARPDGRARRRPGAARPAAGDRRIVAHTGDPRHRPGRLGLAEDPGDLDPHPGAGRADPGRGDRGPPAATRADPIRTSPSWPSSRSNEIAIREVAVEVLSVDEGSVTEEARFKEDLDATASTSSSW